MDKIVAGIVVAALSGLTVLAYRHPKTFRPLGRSVQVLVALVFFGGMVWDISNINTYGVLIEYIQFDKLSAANAASNGIKFLNWVLVLSLWGIIGYMEFLLALPFLFELAGEEPPQKKDKTES